MMAKPSDLRMKSQALRYMNFMNIDLVCECLQTYENFDFLFIFLLFYRHLYDNPLSFVGSSAFHNLSDLHSL